MSRSDAEFDRTRRGRFRGSGHGERPLAGDRRGRVPGHGGSAGARDWRIGWCLTPTVPDTAGFEMRLDATRREPANDNHATPVEHAVLLRFLIRW